MELVESNDLEYSYYTLVRRLPDKNHKITIEKIGAGRLIQTFNIFFIEKGSLIFWNKICNKSTFNVLK